MVDDLTDNSVMNTQTIASEPLSLNAIGKHVPHWLAYQLRLHRIVIRCCVAIQKNGLLTLSEDQERGMEILVRIFSEQLNDIEYEADSGKSDLWFCLHTQRAVANIAYFSEKLSLVPVLMIILFIALLFKSSPAYAEMRYAH